MMWSDLPKWKYFTKTPSAFPVQYAWSCLCLVSIARSILLNRVLQKTIDCKQISLMLRSVLHQFESRLFFDL